MITKPISKGYTSSIEDNDCTVRALANAKLGYKAAHDLLAKYGRKEKQGVSAAPAALAYYEAGCKLLICNAATRNGQGAHYELLQLAQDPARIAAVVGFKRISSRKFTLSYLLKQIKSCPVKSKDTFICMIRGHMLCIKEGAIVDTFTSSPNCTVELLWKVL